MSAVASQSVNDVFSADYDNYLVLFSGGGSGSNNINLRMRLSGTDDSTSNYSFQIMEAFSSTVQANVATSQTSIRIGFGGDFFTEIFLYNPNKALPTRSKSNYLVGLNSMQFSYGTHNVSTAFDGFSIIPAAGTITGTLYVYGVEK